MKWIGVEPAVARLVDRVKEEYGFSNRGEVVEALFTLPQVEAVCHRRQGDLGQWPEWDNAMAASHIEYRGYGCIRSPLLYQNRNTGELYGHGHVTPTPPVRQMPFERVKGCLEEMDNLQLVEKAYEVDPRKSSERFYRSRIRQLREEGAEEDSAYTPNGSPVPKNEAVGVDD